MDITLTQLTILRCRETRLLPQYLSTRRTAAAVALLLIACDPHQAMQPSQIRSQPSPLALSPYPTESVARTRDEAYAIALAAVQSAHPGVSFVLRDETTGGGLRPPWVFLILPSSSSINDQIPGLRPVLVEYGSSTVEYLPPSPLTLQRAVQEWETVRYGHPQR